jgi:nuclear transport factor 2 (NTF2) superfamily protein
MSDSNTASPPAPVKPPFTLASATTKVRMAEDAWKSRDSERLAVPCSEDSTWRNRAEFLRSMRPFASSCGANGHGNSTSG